MANFPELWLFSDAERASDILQRAGFVKIETRGESVRVHLRQIPSEELRAHFVADLADQAAKDNPPYSARLLEGESERHGSVNPISFAAGSG